MKNIALFFLLFTLFFPSSLLAQDGDFIKDIQGALENAQRVMEQMQHPNQEHIGNRPISGLITVSDTSRPWYFKMDWFDAAATSRLYVRINNQEPLFLAEFAGPRPPVGAPIEIKGLKPGDRVIFMVKTCWHGHQYGPVTSEDTRFFKVVQKGPRHYYFQFEDAAGYDMKFNDGAFSFYQEGYGPAPNRLIWIKNFKASRAPDGVLFSGSVHVQGAGAVNSIISIKDNRWNVYRTINLSFHAQSPRDYDFKYRLRDPLPAPMYTAIWQVGLGREEDTRIRALKGCIEEESPSFAPSASYPDDLVLYYSFDDCTARDIGQNHLNGTIYGSPECIGGLQVRSLYFNRIDRDNGCGRPGGDFVALPPFGPIFQQGITLCAWARFDSKRSYEKIIDIGNGYGEQGGYNVVFGRLGTTNNIEIESWVNQDGTLNRTTGRLSYPGIVNGQWQHYCATIDNGSRRMRLFINGQLKAEKIGNPVVNVSRNRNFIAHSNWCFNDPDFKGAIDELRIYKRALTPEEIKALYSKGQPNTPSKAQEGVFGSTRKNPFIFQGKIYFLPPGTGRLPDFRTLRPVGTIYTPVLDIPPRSFLQGFPGITDRFEWFAIDYKGKIYIEKPGTYTFSLLSDDGSRLFIDGGLVIDNDGVHPPREKSGSIYLKKGLHNVELQYFQGPRQQIALVLYLIEGNRKIPFDIRRFAPVTMEETGRQTRLTLGSGILFDFNSYSLRPDAIKVLDSVYELLKDSSYRKVIVEGHTDNMGSEEYNLVLSRKRARAVANYLIARGVPAAKIKVVGYGKRRPRFPNDTEEHRAKNRRVEIKILR